jgi:DNA adenine methylase
MLRTQPKPLVKWFGGKARMAQIIAGKMPHHRFYVEPFGGAAGVLMAKSPSEVEIYNDLHAGVVTLFRVIRDQDKCKELLRLLDLTPYARDEWRDCHDTWETETNEIEKARKVYVNLAQNFVGVTKGGSWAADGLLNPKGKPATFYNSLNNLTPVSKRFKTVHIENKPALEVMKRYDSKETLIYADPPYLPETRSEGLARDYKHEMSLDDHIKLLDFLLKAKSQIILSGYPSKLYIETLESAGWVREDYEATASSALRSTKNGLKGAPPEKFKRTGCLWFNPAATPKTLWNLESEAI